jgi:dienelactone hydrolase
MSISIHNDFPSVLERATENVTENVRIQGPAGEIGLSVARPAGPGLWPAIVIGHEGVGVTEALRGLARRLASEGYLAVIPDLFTRDEFRRSLPEADAAEAFAAARAADPETAIAGLPEGKRAIARLVLEWFKTRDTSNYLTDFLAAASWVKQLPEVRAGAVAALGFSFGAGLVARLAAAGAAHPAGLRRRRRSASAFPCWAISLRRMTPSTPGSRPSPRPCRRAGSVSISKSMPARGTGSSTRPGRPTMPRPPRGRGNRPWRS